MRCHPVPGTNITSVVEKDLKHNLGCLTPLYHPPPSSPMVSWTTIVVFSAVSVMPAVIAIIGVVYHLAYCRFANPWERDIRFAFSPLYRLRSRRLRVVFVLISSFVTSSSRFRYRSSDSLLALDLGSRRRSLVIILGYCCLSVPVSSYTPTSIPALEREGKRNPGLLTPLYHSPLSFSMISTTVIVVCGIIGAVTGTLAILGKIYNSVCCRSLESWDRTTERVRTADLPSVERRRSPQEHGKLVQEYDR